MKLTELKIKALKAKEKGYRVTDGNGLVIFIAPTGRKYWRLRYPLENKEKVVSLGEYPYISIKDARMETARLKGLIAKGVDINTKELEPVKIEHSFLSVCEEWLRAKSHTWVKGHTDKQVCRIQKHLYPSLENKAIDKITVPEMLVILRKLEEEDKLETARRLRSIASQVFRYGIACGYCESDPCRDLVDVLKKPKENPRSAITDPQKVGVFMAHIKRYSTKLVRNALLLSAYTFCRPGEIRNAEWSEIDFDKREWLIPAEKMKMRKPHRVPLSDQSISVLREMQGLHDTWVFPSPRKKNQPICDVTVLAGIRSLGYAKHEMCAHGFRAMASTLLNELNYRSDLIEKSLAHGDGDKIRAAYNRAEYFEERRNMMQEYADYLDTLKQIL